MATLTLRSGEVVSYDDHGSGPVVVLIHGSPGTSKAWQRVGERLADRFRVIAPNLPDSGEATGQSTNGERDNSHAAGLIEALITEVGTPAVLAGHSHGGVVALNVALRGRIEPGALALFEPVAVSILHTIGDTDAYTAMKAVFDGYISGFEAGDRDAARTMVDYWFGSGAFERFPAGMKEYVRDNTGRNIRDVRATFRDQYPLDSVRRLAMPVVLVVGARSPEITFKIARALSSLAQHGSLITLDNADHALTTSHAEAVAALIADLAEQR